MAVNKTYFFGSSTGFLLDDNPAVFAVSLRKLSINSTKCIRVERKTDNTQIDIGFSGDFLNTAALLMFASGGNVEVVKMYNQGYGGAVYDAIQITPQRRPSIVSSGNLIINPDTGRASCRYSGGQHLDFNQLAIDFSGVIEDRSGFVVAKATSPNCVAFSFASLSNSVVNQIYGLFNMTIAAVLRSGTNGLIYGTTTDQTALISLDVRTGGSAKCYVDGTITDSNTFALNPFGISTASIGYLPRNHVDKNYFVGYIDEVIFRDEVDGVDYTNQNIVDYYGL